MPTRRDRGIGTSYGAPLKLRSLIFRVSGVVDSYWLVASQPAS